MGVDKGVSVATIFQTLRGVQIPYAAGVAHAQSSDRVERTEKEGKRKRERWFFEWRFPKITGVILLGSPSSEKVMSSPCLQ